MRLPVLKSQDGYGVCATYEIPEKQFSLGVGNLSTNDSDADVRIDIENTEGNSLIIEIRRERAPNVYITSDLRPNTSKSFFTRSFPNNVIVVPTLGQLELDEGLNNPDYVEKIQHTRLAARNFRNVWRTKTNEEFDLFCSLVEANWEGIKLSKPSVVIDGGAKLRMIYHEDGIAREIGMSGFGFQAWMQIMTHMMRGRPDDILVLDEPDVYLHADLQRRLFGIAKKRFRQIFIATHSAELMNEANSGDVVLIRSAFQTGRRLTTEEGYRTAHELLGSSENADFARLSRAKRIIAYEGKDRAIYRRFEQLLGIQGAFGDPDTVMLKIGGFEQWPKVGNIPWSFEQLFGIRPQIAAIFDRDFRCKEEIEAHERRLADSGVYCRVLGRKEIENYVIQPMTLIRAIVNLASKRGKTMTDETARALIASTANSLRDEALLNTQSFAAKYFTKIRDRRDTKDILRIAKIEFDEDWSKFGYFIRVGGKDLLSELNQYLEKQIGSSLSPFQLLDAMNRDEVDETLANIIHDINNHFY